MIETLFIAATALNAFLLFSLQPLIAKTLLPHFGGAPAVWSICLVFFQGSLLIGYSAAHFLVQHRTFYKTLLLIPALSICALALTQEISLSEFSLDARDVGESPLSTLALTLISLCGLHAILLSMGSPLLQSAFAQIYTKKNPYKLYAASNYGSLFGLISYPTIIEPILTLNQQAIIWSILFGILGILLSGMSVLKKSEYKKVSKAEVHYSTRWFVIPGISSALLVSVTSYISTDIAPIPLMWVVPFAIFLTSYSIAFRDTAPRFVELETILLRISTLGFLLCWLAGAHEPWILIMPLIFISYSLLCLHLHRKLYSLKPAPEQLTSFYIAISVGGCCGGLFASLGAPMIFHDMRELPLLFIAGLSMVSLHPATTTSTKKYFLLIASVLIPIAGHLYNAKHPNSISNIIFWVPPILACYLLGKDLRTLATRLFIVALLSFFITDYFNPTLFRGRNFFGTLHVVSEPNSIRSLVHGVTVHGSQLESSLNHCEPTAYYHPEGPAGSVLTNSSHVSSVGVIGLGAGALACYGTLSQRYTFFEINPLVVQIAQQSSLFTFLSHSKSQNVIVLGDARLSLRAIHDKTFDILVIDAFSSDSIPVHLLTQEALTEYLRTLNTNGVILAHVSNKYLDLEQVLSGVSKALNLVAYVWTDTVGSQESISDGKLASQWILLAQSDADIARYTGIGGWRPLKPQKSIYWTDQYSSILQIFKPF